MDIRKIKKLIELLESSELLEMEIREGEESIRLSRASSAAPLHASGAGAQAVRVPAAEPAAEPAPVQPAEEAVQGHVVKSPMVGTFYAGSKPGSEPFVEVGSQVEAGDTLCIIEAMKIFNPIESDRAGTVRAVFKENGEPVEYGETLFVID